MYIIRKTNNWSITAIPSWRTISYVFIFLPLIFLSIFFITIFFDKDDNTWIWIILFFSLFSWICCFIWIKMYINDMKIKKLKTYKKTGKWTIKKLKITSIENYYDTWDSENKWFNWYYLEAKEQDTIYCSNAFEGGIFYWTSLEELKKIYKYYWFEYNDKNKNNVLRVIENEIAKNESEAQYDWFLKGFSKKMDVNIEKNWLDTVKKWYIVPHIEINWHKISVWDTIDVYIDPDDEKNYWMDIDFLFDK